MYLLAAFFVLLSLVSYHYQDPSWDTATGMRAQNLTGPIGAALADLALQLFGFAAYAIPVLMLGLAWKWMLSSPMAAPVAKVPARPDSARRVHRVRTRAGLAPYRRRDSRQRPARHRLSPTT